jgi:hypothetical protein
METPKRFAGRTLARRSLNAGETGAFGMPESVGRKAAGPAFRSYGEQQPSEFVGRWRFPNKRATKGE